MGEEALKSEVRLDHLAKEEEEGTLLTSHFLKQKPEIELNSTLPLFNLFPSMHSPRPTVQSSTVRANLWDFKNT